MTFWWLKFKDCPGSDEAEVGSTPGRRIAMNIRLSLVEASDLTIVIEVFKQVKGRTFSLEGKSHSGESVPEVSVIGFMRICVSRY